MFSLKGKASFHGIINYVKYINMKKLSSVFAGLFFLVLSFSANAQTKNVDYFIGKWNVVVEGTPGGDAKMIVHVEKKDTVWSGAVLDTASTEISKISKIEKGENSITVYFTSQGYDVNLLMERKDDDHVTGNMMGMFEAKGERIKEIKK